MNNFYFSNSCDISGELIWQRALEATTEAEVGYDIEIVCFKTQQSNNW